MKILPIPGLIFVRIVFLILLSIGLIINFTNMPKFNNRFEKERKIATFLFLK